MEGNMLKVGKEFAAQFYSFYFSWGFYFSAGQLFCTKKYNSLLMG
jgi:hypothetical protein